MANPVARREADTSTRASASLSAWAGFNTAMLILLLGLIDRKFLPQTSSCTDRDWQKNFTSELAWKDCRA